MQSAVNFRPDPSATSAGRVFEGVFAANQGPESDSVQPFVSFLLTVD